MQKCDSMSVRQRFVPALYFDHFYLFSKDFAYILVSVVEDCRRVITVELWSLIGVKVHSSLPGLSKHIYVLVA